MAALIMIFVRKHWPVLALIASLFVIGNYLYMKGWSERGEKEKYASQTHTINRTDNRGKINETVRAMDGSDLCSAIGGVHSNNECK